MEGMRRWECNMYLWQLAFFLFSQCVQKSAQTTCSVRFFNYLCILFCACVGIKAWRERTRKLPRSIFFYFLNFFFFSFFPFFERLQNSFYKCYLCLAWHFQIIILWKNSAAYICVLHDGKTLAYSLIHESWTSQDKGVRDKPTATNGAYVAERRHLRYMGAERVSRRDYICPPPLERSKDFSFPKIGWPSTRQLPQKCCGTFLVAFDYILRRHDTSRSYM